MNMHLSCLMASAFTVVDNLTAQPTDHYVRSFILGFLLWATTFTAGKVINWGLQKRKERKAKL